MARTIILAALVGSALTLGIIGLMSMTQVLPVGQHVLVSYGPHPRDMMQIKENTPFVVPAGRIFVVTALGSTLPFTSTPCFNSCPGYPDIAILTVNGQNEVSTIAVPVANFSGGTAAIGDITSLKRLPDGFTVQAGAVVAVTGTGSARAWGYLADQ